MENPETSDVVTVIPSHPKASVEAGMISKDAATFFWVGSEVDLEPNETRESVFWLVLTNSVDEAQRYRVLGEVCELP